MSASTGEDFVVRGLLVGQLGVVRSLGLGR